MDYPLVIRASSQTIDELVASTEGIWEDDGRPAVGDPWLPALARGDKNNFDHPHLVFQRHKAKVEIRCEGEFREVEVELRCGTAMMYIPGPVERILDTMRQARAGRPKRKPKISKQERIKATRDARLVALKCCRILKDQRLIEKPATFEKKLSVYVKDMRRGRGGTRRGNPYISVSFWDWKRTGTFTEYSHIKKDPVIGSFESGEPGVIFAIIVAHEIAHAAAWWHYGPRGAKPHGHEWRTIYRALRKGLGHVK